MTQRILTIGDVHGCIEELDALLGRLNLTDKDRLVFAGDLVDKGPDSAGVVRRVREVSQRMKVDLCMGNHEEMFLRWLDKPEDMKTKLKRHDEFKKTNSGLSAEDREYLNTAVLCVQVPGGVVTHAGIPESMRTLLDVVPYKEMTKKHKDIAKTACRVRYVDDKGNFVGLYDTKPEHTFWAERYTGTHGVVYFGHQPWMQAEPKKFPHAYGIDLGCVYGGHLCAVEIDGSGHIAEVHTERAREQYAKLEVEE